MVNQRYPHASVKLRHLQAVLKYYAQFPDHNKVLEIFSKGRSELLEYGILQEEIKNTRICSLEDLKKWQNDNELIGEITSSKIEENLIKLQNHKIKLDITISYYMYFDIF